MSARARPKSTPTPAPTPAGADTPTVPHPQRAFTPRPLLLGVLSTVFSAWMAFLVYLYVTTIYPSRSVSPTTNQTETAALIPPPASDRNRH